jgi:hypothetical protein
MEMKKFLLVAAFTAGAGTLLVLSKDQAKTRAHNLELVEKGPDGQALYRALHPVMFKAGETIGCDATGLNRRDQIALGLEESPEQIRAKASARSAPAKGAEGKKG